MSDVCVMSEPQSWLRESTLQALLGRVATLLNVPTRPIRLHVLREHTYIAFTRFGRPPSVYVPSTVSESVVAHEFAHCLVPTRWLFFAEGVATFVGCTIAGHCRDMLFVETTPAEVVHRYWEFSPSIWQSLLQATLTSPGQFASTAFASFEGRLAHLVAASFVEACLSREERFVQALIETETTSPERFLEQALCAPLDEIHAFWQQWVYEQVQRSQMMADEE